MAMYLVVIVAIAVFVTVIIVIIIVVYRRRKSQGMYCGSTNNSGFLLDKYRTVPYRMHPFTTEMLFMQVCVCVRF